MTYMTAQRESLPTWLEGFPFEQKLWQNVGPETPLFVDIGGAAGHQCVALKGKFPHVPGRIILQDLPAVIKLFNPAEGIEPMSYDFWTPQPIKGLSSSNSGSYRLYGSLTADWESRSSSILYA